jgi:hypothetical protein
MTGLPDPALRLGLTICLTLALITPGLSAQEQPLRQQIDAAVRAAWQREKLTPASRADDATFLRRIYLDLLGTIPNLDETKRFLQEADPKKREKLIDKLLDDPRFAVHQADVWDLVLFGRNPPNGDATRKRDGFKKWLTEKFAKNEPYDRWVRELLLAEQDGPALFYVQYRSQPEEATVAVSRIFLGTQLQCARCHDHPFESWTQRDFYGMAAFFARLVIVDGQGPDGKPRFLLGEKSTGDVLFTGPAATQKPGQKGEPIKAKFLGGVVLDEPPLPKGFKEPTVQRGKALVKPLFSRKENLAAWVVAADNPYFARAAANRVWAQFLGRGLVHPVDDLSVKHPPSHPELFEALTKQLVAHQLDLKWYIRELVNSEAYQLAAAGPTTEAAPPWFERARVRPLSAEEILAAFCVATGFSAPGKKPQEAQAPSDLAMWIPLYFAEPIDGRGNFQASLTEHLFLNNSEHLHRLIQRHKGNLADTLLSSRVHWEERVDQLFLAVLNRPPRPEERRRFVVYLTADPKAADALMEEAIWVLLNCSEFRFNH